MSDFAQPALPKQGDQFDPREHNGRLLLIYPKAYLPVVETKFGDSRAADGDVIVVDAPGGPAAHHGSRLFGNLAGSLEERIGQTVLARLGQAPTSKGNPAWILREYSEADAALAGPVHQKYQAGAFSQPVTAAPAQASAATSVPPSPWDATAPASPTPAVASAAPAIDPALAEFLRGKGVDPGAVEPDQARLIAQSLGWAPTPEPPF